MRATDPNFLAMHTVRGLSSGEGVIYRLRDAAGKDPGVTDKRLVAEETEFSAVMNRARREGSTLAQVLRDGWDAQTLQTVTKESPLKASNPHLGMIGHITPRELRMRLAEAEPRRWHLQPVPAGVRATNEETPRPAAGRQGGAGRVGVPAPEGVEQSPEGRAGAVVRGGRAGVGRPVRRTVRLRRLRNQG